MSTEVKHTHSPWVCFYKDKYKEWHVGVPVSSGSMKLALFPDGCPTENPEADSRLIACAPDLLALAKQHASECLDCNYGDGATGKGSEGEPCEECADIRAVIDRAEGRL